MPLPIAVTRINLLAQERHISVREMQRVLGIAVGTVPNWNQQTPVVDSLIPIANYLNTSLDYLCGLTDNPFRIDEFNSLTEPETQLLLRIVAKKYTPEQIAIINDYLDEAEKFPKAHKEEVK